MLTVINASAAVTLLEQRPEKNSGSERDSNPRPLMILGPSITSTFKGLTRIRPLSCGFDSSVGRALHWHRRGRGFESRSEPEFFSGLCSSSVTAALALMTVSTQLLLMYKINLHPTILGPSITSTFKGLTRIRPLSCGFDSSVGKALHWHRRGRGFESRSEPEFFSGLCSSSVTAALALMTASVFASSTCEHLRLLAGPFDQGLKETEKIIASEFESVTPRCLGNIALLRPKAVNSSAMRKRQPER